MKWNLSIILMIIKYNFFTSTNTFREKLHSMRKCEICSLKNKKKSKRHWFSFQITQIPVWLSTSWNHKSKIYIVTTLSSHRQKDLLETSQSQRQQSSWTGALLIDWHIREAAFSRWRKTKITSICPNCKAARTIKNAILSSTASVSLIKNRK